jgi:uncharacterized membrane protein
LIRGVGLALWLLGGAALAQDLPALHKVTGVAAGDVLNVRERPDATAPVVGTLSPDATGIEVVALDGTWALVNTSDTTGYAASRFLTREAGPHWNTLQRPLYCLGTEPFWDLAISPQTGTAWLSTPEDPDPEALTMGPVWPALPWSRVAAFAVPDGIVTLSPADCGDGMSDRRYGIAVDIFLTRPGTPRLSGCCGLSLP